MAKQPSIRALIEELGGISAVARDLGHDYHTTVQYWFDKDRLPKWRRPELVALAKRKKVALPEGLAA